MKRLEELEARRRMLLSRCEEQRIELAYRVAQLGPAAQLTAWTRRHHATGPSKHPLAWVAGLTGLLVMMLRTRKLLTGVTWITGLIALASRATTLLRIFAQLRRLYFNMKSPPR